MTEREIVGLRESYDHRSLTKAYIAYGLYEKRENWEHVVPSLRNINFTNYFSHRMGIPVVRFPREKVGVDHYKDCTIFLSWVQKVPPEGDETMTARLEITVASENPTQARKVFGELEDYIFTVCAKNMAERK